MSTPTPSDITALLAETHQGEFRPEAIEAAAQFISNWPNDAWRRADKTGQPMSVLTCLYAYMAALDEAADPQLTLDRLERQAERSNVNAQWHVNHAIEFAGKARARELQGSLDLAADHRRAMSAHVICANEDRARAVGYRILRAELAAGFVAGKMVEAA